MKTLKIVLNITLIVTLALATFAGLHGEIINIEISIKLGNKTELGTSVAGQETVYPNPALACAGCSGNGTGPG